MLANGAAVNWVDDLGSGLHWAARSGHGELLDLLTPPGSARVGVEHQGCVLQDSFDARLCLW